MKVCYQDYFAFNIQNNRFVIQHSTFNIQHNFMFTGFPKISTKLIETLISQGFMYFVKQRYPVHPDHAMPRSFLFSPFKEDYKAEHYYQRLNRLIHPEYYNLNKEEDKKRIFDFAEGPLAGSSYIKVIEHN